MKATALALVSAYLIALVVAVATARAAPMPRNWHAQRWWLAEAVCIHGHEGAWNSIGYVNGVATYGGGMQFMLSTWQSVGGSGSSLADITVQSPREQLYRAWLVWQRDGGSWSEWGTRGMCSLR